LPATGVDLRKTAVAFKGSGAGFEQVIPKIIGIVAVDIAVGVDIQMAHELQVVRFHGAQVVLYIADIHYIHSAVTVSIAGKNPGGQSRSPTDKQN
jgi:hypothetical protein